MGEPFKLTNVNVDKQHYISTTSMRIPAGGQTYKKDVLEAVT